MTRSLLQLPVFFILFMKLLSKFHVTLQTIHQFPGSVNKKIKNVEGMWEKKPPGAQIKSRRARISRTAAYKTIFNPDPEDLLL
jgi:hypothetical protein